MSSKTTILEAIAGNPATAEIGCLAASATQQALSATTTKWSAGVWISNGDASTGVYVGASGVTATAGANRIFIGPGQCLPYLLSNNLAAIFIISSGTPLITYQASST